MALFWACRTLKAGLGPLKVQGQSIKNNGKHPIYIFDIEDDAILDPASMFTYSQTCILPGIQMDLTNHPFVNASSVSNPDLDICIHSPDDIEVGITSSDLCDRWATDPTHPWNGAALPNGQYTRHFLPGNGVKRSPVGNLGIPAISGGIGLPVGHPGYMSGISINTNGQVRVTLPSPIEYVDVTITIKNDTKQCTCPSLELFRNGCNCGAVSKKKWGLQ